MASFNISKGLEKNLPTTKIDGNLYFCTDTGNMYIDYQDGSVVSRKLVNKDTIDAKANSADIARTVSTGTAAQNVTYWKVSNFGNWGTGAWYEKGFSMLLTSRAGEMIWVSLAANDSATSAEAIRLFNRYSKMASISYSVSESAIYITAAGWSNNICAHILSNINGDYVPTISQASALPADAVAIPITEMGPNSDQLNIGCAGSKKLNLSGSTDRPLYNSIDLALKSDVDKTVLKSGDTMTGQLKIHCSNPYLEFKDSSYDTVWYVQASQDTIAFGPTYANAVKTDKNGNMTVPGTVYGSVFKCDSTEAAIKPSDSNEVNFGSSANYIYFGYENRVGSSGRVDTYKFGTHSGVNGASSGNIECGTVKIGSSKLVYDSTNECLNFTF